MDYTGFPIFQNIAEEDIERMMRCLRARQCSYESGELICEYDGAGREVGVLISGTAQLARIDYSGVRTILEHLERGSVFGEVLSFSARNGDSVSVACETPCWVLFLDYSHMMRPCENACEHHSQLIQNMFSLVTGQIQHLSQRVEVLSRRSIREKLLCYFAIQQGSGASFRLPFTFSTLADYISTDRSAMMRELRKLRNEGLVQVDGRQIALTRQ